MYVGLCVYVGYIYIYICILDIYIYIHGERGEQTKLLSRCKPSYYVTRPPTLALNPTIKEVSCRRTFNVRSSMKGFEMKKCSTFAE